jgi:hypothetical protein
LTDIARAAMQPAALLCVSAQQGASMARIKIIVRYNGVGWLVTSTSQRKPPPGRPYSSKDQALSDAFFASRMLEAMGDEVAVFVEGPNGMVETSSQSEQVFRKH